MNTLLAKKLSMTQRYDQVGSLKTVTVLEVQPHVVIGKRTLEKDGRERTLVGVGKKRKTTKALLGMYKDSGVEVVRKSQEIITDKSLEIGTVVNVSEVLKPGDLIRVSGTSKGKGFTGVVKRHGFAGGPKTHGQSDRHRAPGSIGAGTDPGRVFKGLRMAGRSGGVKSSVRNLTVLYVESAAGLVYVSGPVPGHYSSNLVVEKLGESKRFKELVMLGVDSAKIDVVTESVEVPDQDTAETAMVEEVKE